MSNKTLQRSDDSRDEYLLFERLITDLSARFVNIAPEQVDGDIENALKLVLDFFQVDRCGLLGTRPNNKIAFVTHAWYAEGVEKVAGDINLATLFPWRYERLFVQGVPVSTSKMEALPPEAETDRQTYFSMGVRSSLDIPVLFRDQVRHVIVIQSLREERGWPEEYILRLRLLGEIFLNALERRNADRALRESDERLSLAADSAGAMLWDLDVGSGRIWTTERAKEFFGFAPAGEMNLESFLNVVYPEDREKLRRIVEETVRSGTHSSAEYRIVRPDGSIRWILSRGRPYAPTLESASRLMGVSIDITDRKRTEEELRKSAKRLRDITFSMADWVWEVDENGVYTYSSAKGLELFGHVVGKTPFDFMTPDEAARVGSLFSAIAAKKAPIRDLENWNIRKDGEMICLLTNGVPILDEKGNLKGYRGVDKDITERKRAVGALRKSERLLAETEKIGKVGGWELDIVTGKQTWTEEVYRIHEVDLTYEPTLERGVDFYTPVSRPIIEQALQRAVDHGEPFDLELYIITAKGNLCGIHVIGKADLEHKRVYGFFQDVTLRRLSEAARMESMARYQAIVEAFDGFIYICSPDYRIEFMNQRLIERTGHDAVGALCYKALHDRDSVCEWCVNERVFQGETLRWEVQSPKDQSWFYVVNSPIPHVDGTISKQAMIMDITERKRAEVALLSSEERFRALAESALVGIYVLEDGKYSYVNPAMARVFGYSVAEMTGMRPREIVHHCDYGMVSENIQRRITGEVQAMQYEVRGRHKDGSTRDVEVFGTRIEINGRPALVGTLIDITERKRAEDDLLVEKNKLQSIMSAINTGITIRNHSYELIYQNDFSLSTFGNHLGEKCYRVFAGIDHVCDDCPVEKTFKDGKSHSHVKEVEVAPGEITYWENTAVPMKDGEGNIYACLEINNNITERKKSEEVLKKNEAALRNSQKDLQKLAGRLIYAQEEELRRLSRELHDDLTQRLAVLAIDAGKLELDLGKKPEACPAISQKISQMKEQLISVAEDVHAISRQLHPTILDDLGLVRAIESECAAIMRREDIEIIFSKRNVPAEVGNDIALCIYRVLQESLKNVITHSRATNCGLFLEGVDNTLSLTVSDNGIGFDPVEVRHKSGLGLSSMRERAQLVQGVFSITSRPGQGTAVHIRVPLEAGCA